MEIIINLSRSSATDPRRLFEVLQCGPFHCSRGSEMHEERPLPGGTNSRDVVQRRGGEALCPLLPVGSDRKSVSFVSQALKIEQQSRIWRKRQLAPSGEV